MNFLRRVGPAPEAACSGCHGCPDILELDTGDFAVIGQDITAHAPNLPAWAGCADDERIVRIPRMILVRAKEHIPSMA